MFNFFFLSYVLIKYFRFDHTVRFIFEKRELLAKRLYLSQLDLSVFGQLRNRLMNSFDMIIIRVYDVLAMPFRRWRFGDDRFGDRRFGDDRFGDETFWRLTFRR